MYAAAGATSPDASAQVAPAASPAPAPVLDPRLAGPGDYELVTTPARLDAWIDCLREAPLIAFDTETSSLDPMRAELVGVSFAVEPRRAAYVPLAHDYPGVPAQLPRETVLAALKPILEDPTRPKLGQNLKYDINVLSNHGITLRGLAHDTMLVWPPGAFTPWTTVSTSPPFDGADRRTNFAPA